MSRASLLTNGRRLGSCIASGPTALLLALAAACAGPKPAPPPPAPSLPAREREEPGRPSPVDYTLSPEFGEAGLAALRVEIRFLGDPSGVTRLELPDEWASVRELWKYLRDLEIEGARAVDEQGPAVRVIHAEKDAPLVVRYRVVSAFDRDPTATDGQLEAPIIRPSWFRVFGETVFAEPAGREEAPVRFTWTGAPTGLRFASDLEHLAGAPKAVVNSVIESVAVGGTDLEVRTDATRTVRVAILGRYGFSQQAFIDLALSVITSERDFWSDPAQPFLVTLVPQKRAAGAESSGGIGRADAFALMMAEDTHLDRIGLLLAHEQFHTWNPAELRGRPAEADPEGAEKWFSEGFTEFYTWRLLLRAGLFGLEEFAAAWNAALLDYDTSPVRTEPNERIAKDYWNDAAVKRLPYVRGPLLAALWDHQLRQATADIRDLDDVLLAMRARVRAVGAAKAPPVASLFASAYRAAGGPDLSADLDRLVGQGKPITLPAGIFGDCIRVKSSVRRPFDRGWDPEATSRADNVITGLRAGSPAYRAGLRNGMKIVGRESGQPGDSTVAYVLRVQAGPRERRIRFQPEGPGHIAVRQLELDPASTPKQREACARRLSGAE